MTTWILVFNFFLPNHAAKAVPDAVSAALASTVGTWDEAQIRYHGIEQLLAKFAAAEAR